MPVADNLLKIKKELPSHVTLVAVSKTRTVEEIKEAVDAGHVDFGENKVQEMLQKHEQLPQTIRWHMIGHLQTNKVKQVVSFVHLIHSVDSLKLLKEINKEAAKISRKVNCLLQVHIAKEETKFGLDYNEVEEILRQEDSFKNIVLCGLMGMATNTTDEQIIRNEFRSLKKLFNKIRGGRKNSEFSILSMGMSGDYQLAIEEGSNMIRVGTAIFGDRDYSSNV